MATITGIKVNPKNTTERIYTTNKGIFKAQQTGDTYKIFTEAGEFLGTFYNPIEYIKNKL